MTFAIVTGGAGFIGSAISKKLADTFDRVLAIDNLHPQVHPTGKPAAGFDSRVSILVADICCEETWRKALQYGAPDVVVHLAAETGTGQSLTESRRHSEVNVVGISTMLDAFARYDAVPKRIVLASSRAVYGEGAWRITSGSNAGEIIYPGLRSRKMLEAGQWNFLDAEPLPMDARNTPRHPASVYAVTKCAQEDLLKLWADAFGTKVGILRLQNVYGPGQTPENPYTGIMSLFCRQAETGETISLYEDGEMRRDFVLIDDVVSAIMAIIEVDPIPDFPIDIGCGKYLTVAQAAQIFAEIFQAPSPTITGQWRHGDVRHAWASVDIAKQVLGFSAQYAPEEGFRKLAEWIASS